MASDLTRYGIYLRYPPGESDTGAWVLAEEAEEAVKAAAEEEQDAIAARIEGLSIGTKYDSEYCRGINDAIEAVRSEADNGE